MALNLHEIVGDALTIVNDWQNLVFTKKLVQYSVDSDVPTKIKKRIVLQGKIQPASTQELRELGFNLNSYAYYKVFITGTATQMDEINQFASDEFTCGGYKYRIVAKEPWDDARWRECYAYRLNTDGLDDIRNIIKVPTESNA